MWRYKNKLEMLFIRQEIIIHRLWAHNKQMVAGQILSDLSLLEREELSSVGKKIKLSEMGLCSRKFCCTGLSAALIFLFLGQIT